MIKKNTKKSIYHIIVIICINFGSLFGSNEIDLKGKIYTFDAQDSSSNLIFKQKPIFELAKDYAESQLSRGNTWRWVKFQLENNTSAPIENYLVVRNGLIEYVSFFVENIDKNEIEKSFHTGIAYPFSQRPLPNRQFTMPLILQPHSHYSIYVRGHINTGTLIMPLCLYNKTGYEDYIFTHNSLTTFTLTIWLLVCIIGIVLYFLFKERLYLVYAMYVFLLMLFWASYEALSYQLLWPNSTFMANNSRNCYLMAGIFFSIFILSILTHSGKQFVKIKKIIKIMGYLFFVLTFVISFSSTIDYNLCTQTVILADILLVTLIAILIYVIVRKLIEKNEFAIFILISACPIIFYVIIQFLSYYKIVTIPRTGFYMQYGFGLCSVLEISCLFGLLIYRFKRIITLNILSQQTILASNSLINDYKDGVIIEKNNKYDIVDDKTNQELTDLMHKLEALMQSKHIYKEQNINIKMVSEMLQSNSHKLSKCINYLTEMNFNDYINKQRVEAALALLKSKKYETTTIEGIGEEVGFASKATFYNSFKKFTEMTPTQYIGTLAQVEN